MSHKAVYDRDNVDGITALRPYQILSYDEINGRFQIVDDYGRFRTFVMCTNSAWYVYPIEAEQDV